MSHELRALITRSDAVGDFGDDIPVVALPQDFALVPITDELYDRLGGGPAEPLPEAPYFLSVGVQDMAERLSSRAPTAYIESESFGGVGTQTSVVWRAGSVVLGPLHQEFRWGEALPSRETWPVNSALAAIGASSGEHGDEFDALRLGRKRHTCEWVEDD